MDSSYSSGSSGLSFLCIIGSGLIAFMYPDKVPFVPKKVKEGIKKFKEKHNIKGGKKSKSSEFSMSDLSSSSSSNSSSSN
jgi:hypothetical protein